MICPVCGAECLPEILEDMNGKKFHRTLQYHGRQEPVFYCPNALPHDRHGMNLWTVTNVKRFKEKEV